MRWALVFLAGTELVTENGASRLRGSWFTPYPRHLGPPDTGFLSTAFASCAGGPPLSDHGDMLADPEEFSNLWAQSKYCAVRSRLQVQLLDRVLAAHDPLPLREQPY